MPADHVGFTMCASRSCGVSDQVLDPDRSAQQVKLDSVVKRIYRNYTVEVVNQKCDDQI